MTRPSKDEYFMMLAHAVSSRSLDPDTKHGCIAVDREGAILSTGYNGPPRGVNDSLIPTTRPEKYAYMIHSEQNCIANAARVGTPLEGCIFYVTGIPCNVCMNLMYQVGAEELVLTTRECHSTTEDWYEILEFLKPHIRVRYVKYDSKD